MTAVALALAVIFAAAWLSERARRKWWQGRAEYWREKSVFWSDQAWRVITDDLTSLRQARAAIPQSTGDAP